jgi:hypothetical protein
MLRPRRANCWSSRDTVSGESAGIGGPPLVIGDFPLVAIADTVSHRQSADELCWGVSVKARILKSRSLLNLLSLCCGDCFLKLRVKLCGLYLKVCAQLRHRLGIYLGF